MEKVGRAMKSSQILYGKGFANIAKNFRYAVPLAWRLVTITSSVPGRFEKLRVTVAINLEFSHTKAIRYIVDVVTRVFPCTAVRSVFYNS